MKKQELKALEISKSYGLSKSLKFFEPLSIKLLEDNFTLTKDSEIQLMLMPTGVIRIGYFKNRSGSSLGEITNKFKEGKDFQFV